MKRLVCILFFITLSFSLFAQETRTLAFLKMENTNGDPQYDYLEGIIRGVLLFDLAAQDEIQLVTRSEMDALISEQQLVLSGVVENETLEMGSLLGADYLISGEYIYLGNDVMINLWMVDVESGSVTAYRARGDQENFIHALCEELVMDITGVQQELESRDGERSILSLRDVSPGSLAFYTYIHDAEIYIDGEFVGYSTNDSRVPFELEDLPAGEHEIRVELQWFGVVKMPEFTFETYQETFIIEPGKKLTLRPDIRHFNDWIYESQELYDEYWYNDTMDDGTLHIEEDLSFIGRDGETVEVQLTGDYVFTEEESQWEIVLIINGERHPLEFSRRGRGTSDREWEIDPIRVDARISANRAALEVYRTDIWGNMFYE